MGEHGILRLFMGSVNDNQRFDKCLDDPSLFYISPLECGIVAGSPRKRVGPDSL
jgi:hypothetical protein